MATKEEVCSALQLMENNNPMAIYEDLKKNKSGEMGVLKYLAHQEGVVKSKDISNYMGVSSARMAILLKKLEAKDLVEKSKYEGDGRLTLVGLTPKGKKKIAEIQEKMYALAETMVDEVGIEDLEKIFKFFQKVREVANNQSKEIMEDNHV